MDEPQSVRPATLFVVGTPIGNLADITLRAVETLKRVSHVVAEDTRRTRALLSHLDIKGKKLSSLNANTPERIDGVLAWIEAGKDVAFVTDAGMPGISDPGSALVAEAHVRALPVVCVPGPSAVTTAIALSGLAGSAFTFLGFLPRRGRKRRETLERIRRASESVVIFESAQRLSDTLADLASLAPERRATVCRELTKVHEEVLRGTLSELSAGSEGFRGEVTLVVAGDPEALEQTLDEEALDADIEQLLGTGRYVRDAVEELQGRVPLARRELYARVQSAKERLERD